MKALVQRGKGDGAGADQVPPAPRDADVEATLMAGLEGINPNAFAVARSEYKHADDVCAAMVEYVKTRARKESARKVTSAVRKVLLRVFALAGGNKDPEIVLVWGNGRYVMLLFCVHCVTYSALDHQISEPERGCLCKPCTGPGGAPCVRHGMRACIIRHLLSLRIFLHFPFFPLFTPNCRILAPLSNFTLLHCRFLLHFASLVGLLHFSSRISKCVVRKNPW